MFNYKMSVRLHHTDAAGTLFFGNIFMIAHDAFQEFLDGLGLGIASILKDADFVLPVVHTEADYKKPIFVDDKLTVQVLIEKLGQSSFTLVYRFLNVNGREVGMVKTVHVALEKITLKKIPLPATLKNALRKGISKESDKGK